MTVYVLDVDGVIVGTTPGVNYPLPSPPVLEALRRVQSRGDLVCLCTGRALLGVTEIIQRAGLSSYHIGDGGALIANPLQRVVLKESPIPAGTAARAVAAFHDAGVHMECYTANAYYIEDRKGPNLSDKHAELLGVAPGRVSDLIAFSSQASLIKIFVVARDLDEKRLIEVMFAEEFSAALDLTWGLNPNALPAQYGWLSAKGISKQSAVFDLSEHLKIPLSQFVGVGDSESDWGFMQACGLSATLGNADDELQRRVQSRGAAGRVLPSVNNDGILELFA